jgi:hypothetical protein
MVYFSCQSGGEKGDGMRDFFGPGHADHMIRQSLQVCWMTLPKERRTVDEVKRQLQRLLDRAIRDLEEDQKAFGIE